ncbi:MAG: class II aldolase/adducin family protein, partial [Halanaerobiaceae bacterium]
MKKFKEVVVEAGIEMEKRSLTVGTWGNVSCRDPETGNIFISPSGMDYSVIGPADIVVFSRDGEKIEGERKPSIEAPMHIQIYQAREDVNAVVHTHPTFSTAFAITDSEIPPVSEDFVQIVGETVKCADYALPGTEDLGKNAVEALGDRNAVLLTSHGTLYVGPDMDTAYKVCDVVEKTARIYLLSRSLGEARIIPLADIKAMQEFAASEYGQ